MQYKKPTKEQVSVMAKRLRPLGFVGTGENSMKFIHHGIAQTFDFGAIDPELAERRAIQWSFKAGANIGYSDAQKDIKQVLGITK